MWDSFNENINITMRKMLAARPSFCILGGWIGEANYISRATYIFYF